MSDPLERPGYYAILPADVRYAAITPNAKLLFAEITALCNKSGVCWATNGYFAKLYNVSEKSVSRWVSELIDARFLIAESSTKANGRRYLKPVTKLSRGVDTFVQGGRQNWENSTPDVTPVLNTKSNTKSNTAAKATDTHSLLLELISLVNPKEKPTTERLRVLNGRLKDYTPDEIRNAARVFAKSEWHREKKLVKIDYLLAPSKFGRWYEDGVAAADDVTPENQDQKVREHNEEFERKRQMIAERRKARGIDDGDN